MGDTAIRVESVSKRYRIGMEESRPDTFAGMLAEVFRRPVKNLQRLRALSRFGEKSDLPDVIWALKNVSFEIKRGEVVGIIGSNGAGKSTLLKILSRITHPTEGRIWLRGRVSSLLEVGTGFHPELTGRENVYLNGTILGMTRAEIDRKFNEIVEFSGIEKFIDTPVKRYSSGMRVRLAFSVAAHLDPEILLIDEVLSVGDISFQKKCLGKMDEVVKTGRTILFVSHDMTSISLLCKKAIFLKEGEIKEMGDVREVIGAYYDDNSRKRDLVKWDMESAPGNEIAKLLFAGLDHGGKTSFDLIEEIKIRLIFVVNEEGARINPVLTIKNRAGLTVFSTSNYENPQWGRKEYEKGTYAARCVIPPHILNEGDYFVKVSLIHQSREPAVAIDDAIHFSVYDSGCTRGDYVGEWVGIVRPRCRWTGGRYHG